MPGPAIILVQPQMGENIGAAARAMHNFGLDDLRIVAPRDGWPNEAARSMAAHGVPIVDRAKIFATTREAVSDLHRVYAATAREREMSKPTVSPEDLQAPNAEARVKTGILFGRESSGLDNEDIAEADAILQIPTAPENPSLNIAQAVVIVAYTWFREQGAGCGVQENVSAATKSELQGMLDQLEMALDHSHYWREEEKKPKMWRNLRNLLVRAQMSSQEVRSLRGMIRALADFR